MIACPGLNNANNPQTLLDYFGKIYWPKKIGRSPNTKRLYLNTITLFGRWLGRSATLADLNDDTCSAYLQHRHEEVSAFAADKDKRNLSAIANYAAKKRHIPEFVVLPTISVAMPTPNAVRPDQFQSLLSAAMMTPGFIGDVRASHWWKAFLLFAVHTGERTAAILACRKDWLATDSYVRIRASVRKGKKKPLERWLPGYVIESLAPLMESRGDRIFEWPYTIDTFYNRYKKLLSCAGLPTDRHWMPQSLRRTFATYLELAGGDATKELAHDSRRTTQQSYLDPTVTNSPRPADLVSKMLGMG